MQKKSLKFIIGIIVLLLITGISITFAWFNFWTESGNVETITDGISFKYDIDTDTDITEINKSYAVTNLTFFDPDGTEGKFFSNMAISFQIKLHNTSGREISYTLSETVDKTGPYALCLFSASEITDSFTTINEYITEYGDSITSTLTNGENNEAVIYVYLIGIQPNDAATNDFLDSTFEFDINISATSKID